MVNANIKPRALTPDELEARRRGEYDSFANYLVSVSYTHLDVYKRQACNDILTITGSTVVGEGGPLAGTNILYSAGINGMDKVEISGGTVTATCLLYTSCSD